MDFWTRLDNLIASQELVIDRPKGGTHPRYPDLVYPLDYGYLKSTSGGDGNEIDVWRGSIPNGLLVGIVCTVDTKKKDAEIKLLIGCTEAEIGYVERVYNDHSDMSGFTIRRPGRIQNGDKRQGA